MIDIFKRLASTFLLLFLLLTFLALPFPINIIIFIGIVAFYALAKTIVSEYEKAEEEEVNLERQIRDAQFRAQQRHILKKEWDERRTL
jgi:hypothetical protein